MAFTQKNMQREESSAHIACHDLPDIYVRPRDGAQNQVLAKHPGQLSLRVRSVFCANVTVAQELRTRKVNGLG
jgi:hypothetical protein